MNKIISALSLLSFCVFAWEYVAVRRKLEMSPSFVLNKVAKNFQWGWEKLGCFVAWVSSFLTVFDFTDMLEAGKRLVTPIVSTLTSGFYFFKGYIAEMNLYNHPFLVGFGSLTILSGLFFLLWKFGFLTKFVMLADRHFNSHSSQPYYPQPYSESNKANNPSPRTTRKRRY